MIRFNHLYLTTTIYFLLLGYFTLGKGFAYLHIPGTPIFIGEVFLLFGFFVLLAYFKYAHLSHFKAILLFCAWGFLITVQLFPEYRIEALRDSAMYYYSFFAILFFTLLSPKKKFGWLWKYLIFAFKFILIFQFVLKMGSFFGIDINLVVPGTANINFYWMKFGDLGSLLSAATVLLLMEQKDKINFHNFFYLLIATVLVFMTLTMNRGGFLAFAVGFSIYFFYQTLSKKMKLVYFVAFTALVIFLLLPSQSLDSERSRSFTQDQVISNIISIVKPKDSRHGLAGTTHWRLEFWSDVIHYTASDHLISGQGLGPNLAGIYRFSPEGGERPNKHPHNFTINVFARMGIVGLFLWIMINATYFLKLKKAISRSDGQLRDLLIFFMVIWAAMLVNSSLDVYLEGPMGAIPFWSFMGIGLWLTTLAQHRISNNKRNFENHPNP